MHALVVVVRAIPIEPPATIALSPERHKLAKETFKKWD